MDCEGDVGKDSLVLIKQGDEAMVFESTSSIPTMITWCRRGREIAVEGSWLMRQKRLRRQNSRMDESQICFVVLFSL